MAGSYVKCTLCAPPARSRPQRSNSLRVKLRARTRLGTTNNNSVSLALDASGIGALGAVASAVVSYAGDTVHVRDATASARGAFVDANGSIAGVASGKPRYDFDARLHAADLRSIVAVAQPNTARLVEGSASADVHVQGSGASPAVSGTVWRPKAR